jgi:hypothetical protein
VVMKGELSSGRYSWIVQSSTGREMKQGRLRFGAAGEALDLKPLMQEIAQAVAQLGASAEFVLLAADAALSDQPWQQHLHTTVSFIPSWEWAFRAMRDSDKPKDVVFEALSPIESTATVAAPATGPLSQACLLLSGSDSADANTRWTVLGTAETRRSLSLGTHPVILSEAPLKRGDIKHDLTRLSLAQASSLVLVSERPLNAADRETFELSMLSADAKITLSARVKVLNPGSWKISGLPW